METEIKNPLETTNSWSELEERDQEAVLAAHSIHLKSSKQKDNMRRIFNLGNPNIIRGIQYDKMYCRIAPESVEVMSLLIKNYLLE